MRSRLQGDETSRYPLKCLLLRFRCRRHFLFQNDFPRFIQNAVARPVIAEVQTKRELVPVENHVSIYPNSASLFHCRSAFPCATSASNIGSLSHPAGDRPSHQLFATDQPTASKSLELTCLSAAMKPVDRENPESLYPRPDPVFKEARVTFLDGLTGEAGSCRDVPGVSPHLELPKHDLRHDPFSATPNRPLQKLAAVESTESSCLTEFKTLAVNQGLHTLPFVGPEKIPNRSPPSSFPSLLMACSPYVLSDSSNKTHSTRILQRFSPIHF